LRGSDWRLKDRICCTSCRPLFPADVVEIVGDAPRQIADGFHLLYLNEFFLELGLFRLHLPLLGQIAHHPQDAMIRQPRHRHFTVDEIAVFPLESPYPRGGGIRKEIRRPAFHPFLTLGNKKVSRTAADDFMVRSIQQTSHARI